MLGLRMLIRYMPALSTIAYPSRRIANIPHMRPRLRLFTRSSLYSLAQMLHSRR